MKSILRISEAASIALHAVQYLASDPTQRISTKKLAKILNASEAHLSKVLQRLARAGLVKSVRGPKGGFKLDKETAEITLLNVLEAIEGPRKNGSCLLSHSICRGQDNCIFGNLLKDIDLQVKDFFTNTDLSAVPNMEFQDETEKKDH